MASFKPFSSSPIVPTVWWCGGITIKGSGVATDSQEYVLLNGRPMISSKSATTRPLSSPFGALELWLQYIYHFIVTMETLMIIWWGDIHSQPMAPMTHSLLGCTAQLAGRQLCKEQCIETNLRNPQQRTK